MSRWSTEGAKPYNLRRNWAKILAAGGISIPASYTAHISPIASSVHHTELLRRVKSGEKSAFETPYVVWLQAYDHVVTVEPANQIQELWEFQHPNPEISQHGNSHNRRQAVAKFRTSNARAKISGIAGYFEAVLYKDIQLSTRPDRINAKSPDMFSWFPAFFPLKVSACWNICSLSATFLDPGRRYGDTCILLATYGWSEGVVWMVYWGVFYYTRWHGWWGNGAGQIWHEWDPQSRRKGK